MNSEIATKQGKEIQVPNSSINWKCEEREAKWSIFDYYGLRVWYSYQSQANSIVNPIKKLSSLELEQITNLFSET